MKSHRILLSAAVLMLLSTATFAQSDAQKSFDKMKTFAGSWEGALSGALKTNFESLIWPSNPQRRSHRFECD